MDLSNLEQIDEFTFQLSEQYRADMRAPVRVFADRKTLEEIGGDQSLDQLINVATLPGIAFWALGMPDIHQGYGFPVGGVAATELPHGVISPGGIGFDINCGVRLLRTGIAHDDIADKVEALVHELSRAVPSGYGRSGRLHLSDHELRGVLDNGAAFVVNQLGLGMGDDIEFLESRGILDEASARDVSQKAQDRGRDQLGTLGGGNHFLEVQVVDELFDQVAADAFGLVEGEVTVLIHTGSRGLGHQVCKDYLKRFGQAMKNHGIEVPDRQLACAPMSSEEGQNYYRAMCAAANYAFGNRQVLTHRVRGAIDRILGRGSGEQVKIVYDVAHNIAKVEEFDGGNYCVHRKGATRAFGPSMAELPEQYRGVGQPVFIPGSMGTSSSVLVGTDSAKDLALNSCCHGAGRRMSRTAAKKQVQGHELRRQLEERGITVRCPSNAELAEEAPLAYKDVERVVNVVTGLGIARHVARLRPVGVLKG